MSFLIYDLVFLIIFASLVFWFLYSRRDKLKREGLLYLYRTKFGMQKINQFSSKFSKLLKRIQYLSIACGYILMILMVVLFIQIVYVYLTKPNVVKEVKVPPVMPLIPYLPSLFKIDFLPPFYFTYWILILAVVAISHEFAHGIFARLHKIKIKSTGFGFLGPFLAAFVEVDEKKMEKKPILPQLAVLSAGTFANILVAILFIVIFILFFWIFFVPSGAIFHGYASSIINISKIESINGNPIENPTKRVIFENLNFEDERNITKIIVEGKSYFIDNNFFIKNIDLIEENIGAYNDMPAINSGLKGAITKINGQEIKNWDDYKRVISKYSPGERIVITAKKDGKEKEYEINLTSDLNGKPSIGVIVLNPNTKGIRGKLYLIISVVKRIDVYYESKLDNDLTLFISDLLWWMIIINVSVALVNMLPLGLFDGGRVFYLTILFFTKSEKKSKKIFGYVTKLILLLIGLIMIVWFISLFK